jgi:amidase
MERFFGMEEATLVQLQAAQESGQLTARQMVEYYLERIAALDQQGPQLRAVIEINPEALEIADQLDQERVQRGARGPLHGIPILLKENIATTDRMQTTAGSLALLGARPVQEAWVVQQLRAAGAVILGKANLSEWANFRSSHSSSGWSARGGQCRNPYILDRSPCGSSSGSAVAVAANLVAVSLGTETDGSILCPASMNGIVGIKPTVGLISRAGVIPIAHSQDTVGPFARTVADAAAVLGVLTGQDLDDPATQLNSGQAHRDYTRFLDPDGLRGARIGVPREVYWGYSTHADRIANAALEQIRALGAEIIDPADIPTAKQMDTTEAEMTVLLYEFKADLNRYLASLPSSPVRTLAEIIEFNQNHAEQEFPYFEQELFLKAQATSSLDDPTYQAALETSHRLSRQEGIDAVMDRYSLDALVMPSTAPSWCIDHVNGDPHGGGSSSQPAALAGYPAISVPAGNAQGLPVGITFMGRAFSEPTLIKLAYAYEHHTNMRRPPQFLPTLPI